MPIDTARLTEIVQTFVTETSHVQGAALVTPEGLPLAGRLPDGLEESRVAAMAAAVVSIGDRIGEELQRGSIQHILLEGTKGYSILVLCGKEALFLVLASAEVKQGILMIEIRRVVEEMAQLIG
ncbi:MAG: diacylglyceryl transferase [Leptolyngbya foveolarum]|uniref:Diacylglyceryl transferase n=1 Tax=Leptolyngbya foveolarum TaxID=47253 RepID=A0A2W4TM84_9CYAN|nr:MAG: diacylglyceryl transferase [Leptolyngbya foveolarum]